MGQQFKVKFSSLILDSNKQSKYLKDINWLVFCNADKHRHDVMILLNASVIMRQGSS